MKIMLQGIRRRQKELNRVKAAKKNQGMTRENRALIAHHERLLENDKNYVEPFLVKQCHEEQDFIRHYYFDAKSETAFNMKFHDGKDHASSLRKSVERAAEQWFEDIK